ncbi:sugar ABC transporter permease [Bacillus licheniformis]|jgi:putative aldouronate transport system permease protein|uniref:Transmembrane lipoprotein n=2 Tax=Bacillus licheniformis TaxID=1402 RepID=Q65KX5_BACLD|nr:MULTISPECIES: sugar ABC transporter permease [Bacillus]MBJ7887838.1 sugar ABC transporter permease [Bacillaceae bacterium HSR45]MBY8349855.1 sugar ABC transporter permease [Bacillus sp. PCH94]MDP4080425.1 sugar ABC transporter permease [Bacillota bacterium]AAU22936.1 transmembrane lipoprotein [Bacillus licheniformis DSM 13 = ATCC 14580]AAU40289.1 carbohydrate ABC transporter permease LplB [Bacillus licheniformis DSM 13 = ATCC 14580]
MEITAKTGKPAVKTEKKPTGLEAVKRDKWLYLLLVPGVLYFLIFKYWPMWGVLIAFKDYSPYLGFWQSEWVGFEYFKDFFMNPDFFRLLRNTLMLAALDLIFAFPAPLIVALLLNELRHAIYKRCIQTFIYVPHFVSWTIVVSITFVFFTVDTGVMNKVLQSITGREIAFLSDPEWFRPMIVLQSIWKETGWGTILFLAALASVDQEQYEAAVMDGAGRLRRMWHITLPAIRSTIVVLLILRIGSFLNIGFEQIFLMTNSLNRSVAEIFDTYVYVVGITQGAYSYSTAVGLFKSVVGIILIFCANYIAKKFDQDGLF